MKNNDMDKQCKGCMIHERYIEDPNTYSECEGFIKEDIDCPCPHCLLKMICDNPCLPFKKRPWVKDADDAE
jgi:hypothetical protein